MNARWMASLICFAVLFSVGPAVCAGDAVTVYAEDDAAPWSQKDGTGYANAVVVAAFSAVGVQATLVVVPYARCKALVVNGKGAACFSMSWDPGLSSIVVFAEHPLFVCYADYFRRADKPTAITKEAEIPAGLHLGTVNGYEYPPYVATLARRGVIVEAFNSEETSLRMLAHDRIDLALINHNETKPAEVIAARAGVLGQVAFAFRSGELKSYIGFSTRHSRGAWALEKFNEGFRLISHNGTLTQIANEWADKARQEIHAVASPGVKTR